MFYALYTHIKPNKHIDHMITLIDSHSVSLHICCFRLSSVCRLYALSAILEWICFFVVVECFRFKVDRFDPLISLRSVLITSAILNPTSNFVMLVYSLYPPSSYSIGPKSASCANDHQARKVKLAETMNFWWLTRAYLENWDAFCTFRLIDIFVVVQCGEIESSRDFRK